MSQARSVTPRTVSRSSPARSSCWAATRPSPPPLLAIAALELAISAKLPTGGVGLFRTSLTHRAEPAEISSAPVPGATGKDLLLAHQRRTTTNDRCN